MGTFPQERKCGKCGHENAENAENVIFGAPPKIPCKTSTNPIFYPLRDAIFPREKGKTAFVRKGFSLKRPFSLFRVGKNRISQGVENRGSLISVPLALRVKRHFSGYFI